MSQYLRKGQFLSIGCSLALLFAVALASVERPASAQSVSATAIGVENFGKVNDHYYRGSQPTGDEFLELKRLGIKTVIDLRQDRIEKASEWAQAAGLKYLNIPLTTKRPATEQQTSEFLSVVNDPANWPVFVHCKGGRHRTGEMTAIYRITQDGWNANQAYEEMKKYHFENNFLYPRSLKKFVFSYYDHFVSEKSAKPQAVTSP
jgi:protein tyrosine/serine phosphatase